jgi:Shikimate dehydrogenase substrate binding domain
MITATTRLVALLGHPVSGSLSPRMQNAAFAARALDWVYVACDVEPADLAAAVAGLRALGFAGANVTIPHKGAAAALCDELDDLAARAGAVNTLVFGEGGRIVGTNTDGPAPLAPSPSRSRMQAPRPSASHPEPTPTGRPSTATRRSSSTRRRSATRFRLRHARETRSSTSPTAPTAGPPPS